MVGRLSGIGEREGRRAKENFITSPSHQGKLVLSGRVESSRWLEHMVFTSDLLSSRNVSILLSPIQITMHLTSALFTHRPTLLRNDESGHINLIWCWSRPAIFLINCSAPIILFSQPQCFPDFVTPYIDHNSVMYHMFLNRLSFHFYGLSHLRTTYCCCPSKRTQKSNGPNTFSRMMQCRG